MNMSLVPAHFHSIRSIRGRRESWRLRVKVVRLWNMTSVAKPHDPFATQMWGRIEATVPKQHMAKFMHSVIEGEVYRVTNFGVGIPLSGLSLVKTMDIKKTNGRSNFLIDFMGIVSEILEEIMLNKEGRQTRLMLLDLVDEMTSCTYSHLAKVNLYKVGFPRFSEVGIQNVMNATKFFWNLDLPEAIDFKNGYKLKLEVGDGTDSVQLILFDSECYTILNKSCRDMLSEQKVSLAEYPCEMKNVVGKELHFRYKAEIECEDSTQGNFMSNMKFSPSFNKIGAGNGNPCVMEVSPHCPSAGRDIEVSPIACMQKPPIVDDSGSACKRDNEEATDGVSIRKRRGKGDK
ncbi:Nucleic acid-binding, OB-fold [Sesbania bispinosa]|nr:Nucleic acid-binding, OB-fold [Sesbania bispinosa]